MGDFNLIGSSDNRNLPGAWTRACRTKEGGGLGILNLRSQNKALLLKSADKFYDKVNNPWVSLSWIVLYNNSLPPHRKRSVGSFWWRDVMSLSMEFRGLATCSFGDGLSVSIWDDTWNLALL